jgi:uncharacterized protein YndB with AHSA1/START domain
MQEAPVVRCETRIPAPPAAVFAAMIDPQMIVRWMGTEAQVEPEPGGIYLVNVTGARSARGSFREVVPVHRLGYSFGWTAARPCLPVEPGRDRSDRAAGRNAAAPDPQRIAIRPRLRRFSLILIAQAIDIAGARAGRRPNGCSADQGYFLADDL